jgi:hypothetical protein
VVALVDPGCITGEYRNAVDERILATAGAARTDEFSIGRH